MNSLKQLFRFGQVGVAGFLVDWAAISLFLWIGVNFFGARALSYLCAATATWFLNRMWTFEKSGQPMLGQWAKFLLANSVGGLVNYGIGVLLVLTLPQLIHPYPVIAVAAGSIGGMLINFILSKRFVFKNSSSV